MFLELLSKLNFFDFIILIILIRICSIGAKMGFSIEIFKLLGVTFSTYIGLHYYAVISALIQSQFLPKGVPLEVIDFIIFLLLVVIGYLCFVVLRNILFRFMQFNAIPKINQFFGLVLGIGRGFLVVGLLSFTLVISNVAYFSNSVKYAYLGQRALAISPRVYDWLWMSVFSKFFPEEKFNPQVNEVISKFNRK
ncbi:MAG: CvpA family protein [Candidatus Omnitrophota bacterium]